MTQPCKATAHGQAFIPAGGQAKNYAPAMKCYGFSYNIPEKEFGVESRDFPLEKGL